MGDTIAMANINLNNLPYNRNTSDIMFSAKEDIISKIAQVYNITADELKRILHKELSESNGRLGTCNTAIDFLAIETIDKKKMYKSITAAIKENILASAIYYANVLGETYI
jgi:hypothetical protein